mmetsp:Transcript_45100/g.45511  ORF Transcript_45100/g.45511 Transcript_45100/m.45511 type:complete len:88 (-) Transcript_45100:400-663(-)
MVSPVLYISKIEYDRYQIAILHVTASREVIFERVKVRFQLSFKILEEEEHHNTTAACSIQHQYARRLHDRLFNVFLISYILKYSSDR